MRLVLVQNLFNIELYGEKYLILVGNWVFLKLCAWVSLEIFLGFFSAWVFLALSFLRNVQTGARVEWNRALPDQRGRWRSVCVRRARGLSRIRRQSNRRRSRSGRSWFRRSRRERHTRRRKAWGSRLCKSQGRGGRKWELEGKTIIKCWDLVMKRYQILSYYLSLKSAQVPSILCTFWGGSL